MKKKGFILLLSTLICILCVGCPGKNPEQKEETLNKENLNTEAHNNELPYKETEDEEVQNTKAQNEDGYIEEQQNKNLREELSSVSFNEENNNKSREILPKYKDLLEVNPYIAGWLRIEDTVIDLPVVYTPGYQNYFLHRDIDGSNTSRGTLFIAINWQENYNNTLIYGHNMKDGTAFGSLDKFADKEYGLKHRKLSFDTLYEEREYQLYGVFYSVIAEEDLETDEDRAEALEVIEEESLAKKESLGESTEAWELTLNDIDLFLDFGDVDIYRQEKDEDNGRFRYYYYTDLSEKADFDYYAKCVKERSLYDTGVEAEWGDEFVTLSTCSYHVPNGRLVLVGIMKR
ncbi:MAG: class B sortase [Lachnospiraceae bacterium]|nr:class B sortase [Lachnospiraceae bacterium]